MKVFVVTEEEVWDSYETPFRQVVGVFSTNEKASNKILELSLGREVEYLEHSDNYLIITDESHFYYDIIVYEVD